MVEEMTDVGGNLLPIHPRLGGVGVSAAIVSYLVGLYYNVILTWCIYYLYQSFSLELPWTVGFTGLVVYIFNGFRIAQSIRTEQRWKSVLDLQRPPTTSGIVKP